MPGKPGSIWIEGNQLCYIDADGTKHCGPVGEIKQIEEEASDDSEFVMFTTNTANAQGSSFPPNIETAVSAINQNNISYSRVSSPSPTVTGKSMYTWNALDTWEDGTVSSPTNSNWGVDHGTGSRIKVLTDNTITGAGTLQYGSAAENSSVIYDGPRIKANGVKVKVRPHEGFQDDPSNKMRIVIADHTGQYDYPPIAQIKFDSSYAITASDGSNLGSWSYHSVYEVTFTDIDFTNKTCGIKVESVNDASVSGSTTGINFSSNNAENLSRVRFAFDNFDYNLDNWVLAHFDDLYYSV